MNVFVTGLLTLIGVGVLSAITSGPTRKKRRKRKSTATATKRAASAPNDVRRASTVCRPDEVILVSPLDQISGAEFERLLALYFRDQGYTVKEVGVGGSDGGVDLVITDKRGEKTAVQAKCYADHNKVGVPIVRELVGAKRNHDCILSLLVTTSDLTPPAKKEAEQFHVDYWHGSLVEQKLRAWGKWQPSKKKSIAATKTAAKEISAARSQVAASSAMTCECGAPMVKRQSKDGKSFWGCSKFPTCRRTRPI